MPELMTVIVIVGVLGAVAMFGMRNYGNQQSTASLARSLQFALLRARSEASGDNTQRRLVCVKNQCSYQMAASPGMGAQSSWLDAGNLVAAASRATIWNITPTIDQSANNAGGTQMSATKTITFYPDGSATPATAYVTETGGRNANRYKVYVYAATGMARLVNNW